jgi:hypothetical protein
MTKFKFFAHFDTGARGLPKPTSPISARGGPPPYRLPQELFDFLGRSKMNDSPNRARLAPVCGDRAQICKYAIYAIRTFGVGSEPRHVTARAGAVCSVAPLVRHMRRVTHCSFHCHLANIHGFIKRGKYSAVIGQYAFFCLCPI